VDATGTVSVTVGQANVPTAGAPAPTEAAIDVISLYSDAYTNQPITTLGTDWSNSNAGPRLTTVTLGDDDVLKFTDLLFAGIEFVGANLIDASAMTHFHVDVWTHDANLFKVKLVDFGANGAYDGPGTADDTEHEWTFNATSTPALTPDGWVSLDIPLAALGARAHLAQLVVSSDEGNVYVDNLYFFEGEVVEPPPEPVRPDFPVLFGDNYANDVSFAPFGGSNNVLTLDPAEKHGGEGSLRIEVPVGGYTGGALKAAAPKDLSTWNAVTFWAKASRDANLDKVGIGNDGASTAFFAERLNLPLTTAWQKFVMPIPLPSKLTAEAGLFHFAEGDATAYSIWIDDVRYETLDSSVLGTPTAGIAQQDVPLVAGEKKLVDGMVAVFPVDGVNAVVTPLSRRWFTWASSDEAVATVDEKGEITAVAEGSAGITAKLGAIDAGGVTTAIVSPAPVVTAPETAAPAPTHPSADVISLFSNAYTNRAVDTWSSPWDTTGEPSDVDLGGGELVKKYPNIVFAIAEFVGANLVDATAMTHVHLDIWTPDATVFKIKLVDWGADAAWAGGDDKEHELVIENPAKGEWVTVELPLTDFTTLTARNHLAQLILSAHIPGDPVTPGTLFIDNIYFHK
jgi:hypothetical protein